MSKNYTSKRISPFLYDIKREAQPSPSTGYSQNGPIHKRFQKFSRSSEHNQEIAQFQLKRKTQPPVAQRNAIEGFDQEAQDHSLAKEAKSEKTESTIEVIEELSSDSQDDRDEAVRQNSGKSNESTQVERMKTQIKRALKDTEFKKFLKKALQSQEGGNCESHHSQSKEGTSQATTGTLGTDEEKKERETLLSFSDNKFNEAQTEKFAPTKVEVAQTSDQSQEYESNFNKSAPPIPSQHTPQFAKEETRVLSETRVRKFEIQQESSSEEEASIILSRFYYDEERDSLVKCTEFDKFKPKDRDLLKLPVNAKGRIACEMPLTILEFQYEQWEDKFFECALYTQKSTWGTELKTRKRAYSDSSSSIESDETPQDDDDWFTDEELENQTSKQTFKALYAEVNRREKRK